MLYSCDFSKNRILKPQVGDADDPLTVLVPKRIIRKPTKRKGTRYAKGKAAKKAKKALVKKSPLKNSDSKSSNVEENAVVEKPKRGPKKKVVFEDVPLPAEEQTPELKRQPDGKLKKTEPTMCAKPSKNNWVECSCSSSATIIIGSGTGWEGAAVLKHGSQIKIGCYLFVFGVTNHVQKELVRKEEEVISGDNAEDVPASNLSITSSTSTLSLSPSKIAATKSTTAEEKVS